MYNAKDFGLKKAMVISTHQKQSEEAIKKPWWHAGDPSSCQQIILNTPLES
jgi:hypothetical protein